MLLGFCLSEYRKGDVNEEAKTKHQRGRELAAIKSNKGEDNEATV